MFDDSEVNAVPPPELQAWIYAWYHLAVTDGFICPPFEIDNPTAKSLHGYFDVGLTPCDGVLACFGMVH